MSIDQGELLAALGESYTDGLRFNELAAALGVRKRDLPQLSKLLDTLVKEGAIVRGRQVYNLAAAAPGDGRVVGRLTVHPAGYGFVAVDSGGEDVFIPAKYRGSTLDGDRVVVKTWEGHKGTEGRVEEVVARGRAKLTGIVRSAGRSVSLEPDDPRIATDFGNVGLEAGAGGARVGQAVVVEIVRYPTDERREMTARVLRVLGEPDDPRTEIEKILCVADIPTEFPAEAVSQAQATAQELAPADFADRIDLRDRPFMTIDPETARDFDDALCIEEGPNGGLRVWVAVADVSHYVRPGDPLDSEASIRGVSVYLPDRVIPMLPFELSSGICSLNPDVDRLAMVARLDFDDRGRAATNGFAAAVIRSHARLDYPGVAAALSGDFRGRRASYRQWRPALMQLDALAQKLRKRRFQRGALELEIPEAKVILDADDPRLVRDVVRSKGAEDVKRAYHLVEEFMIAANEAVGNYFRSRDLTTVWRVHAPPKPSRVEELAELLASHGIDVDVEEALTPRGMQQVLDQIAELPSARSLSFMVLRSLKQAIYDTENVGHFGLASIEYLHFTSPIRRYPDLLVHRLLKFYLHGDGDASGGSGALYPPSSTQLRELADDSSSHERRAVEAEREVVSMYRTYLMREQVGEEFHGVVSGVTHFGAFIELDEPFVEGLIKLESLGDDHYDFDPLRLRLTGRHHGGGHGLGLGDRVHVELIDLSVQRRRIDFRLISGGSEEQAGKGRGGKGKSKGKGKGDGKSKGKGKGKHKR